MGAAEYETAVKTMKQHPGLMFFAGPRAESLVEAAERALGLRFSATYRRFLLEFGAGSFGAAELYGVIDEQFDRSGVPDAVWCTLTEREEAQLPENLVVIQSSGDGGLVCLEIGPSAADRAPVVAVHPGYSPAEQPRAILADDFGAHLLRLVREQVELSQT